MHYLTRRNLFIAKYSKKAQKEIEEELHAHKHDGKWKSREQAVAVGISEAKKKGYKVPQNKK